MRAIYTSPGLAEKNHQIIGTRSKAEADDDPAAEEAKAEKEEVPRGYRPVVPT